MSGRARALLISPLSLANTPEQFADFIRKDTQKWIGLVENAGIRME
jgi:tripartite-type tricarboxylate transporter receptor subunit TctC